MKSPTRRSSGETTRENTGETTMDLEKTLEKPPWISINDQKVSLAHPEHFQKFFR